MSDRASIFIDRGVNCTSLVPKGFRDIMWCPYINEPMILEWRGDEPYCSGCGNDKTSSFEPESHVFICHILKPTNIEKIQHGPLWGMGGAGLLLHSPRVTGSALLFYDK